MASVRDFWHRLLRALGMRALAGHDWVEPGNAITRAIYEGSAFVTMTSWDEAPIAPTSATVPLEAEVEAPAAEAAPPSRKGVAA